MTRKIRTPAELDALPRGVVLTSKGVSVAVKLADGMWGAAGFAGAIDSETVVRCAHGYLSIVGNITAPAPAPSAATARHERAVAYADDVAEGGAPVPDDYERHYCTDDGEDWPCGAARAARVPEAAVERAARAMQAENTPRPDPLNRDQREERDDATIATYRTLARAGLTAALPLLTAAPSATREATEDEVTEVVTEALTDAYRAERGMSRHTGLTAHDESVIRDQAAHVVSLADARFNITPKEDR